MEGSWCSGCVHVHEFVCVYVFKACVLASILRIKRPGTDYSGCGFNRLFSS